MRQYYKHGTFQKLGAKYSLNEFSHTLEYHQQCEEAQGCNLVHSCWFNIKEHRGYTHLTPTSKVEVNDWFMNNTHVILSPITNNCVKINFTVSNETKCSKSILKTHLESLIIILYGLFHKVSS